MTAQVVTYTPADPGGVTSVDRLRLYATAARDGIPLVDVGPAVQQPNGSWKFTLPDPTADGLYYARTTVTYVDATTVDDDGDTVLLPLTEARQLGDPLHPWVEAADVKAAVTGSTDANAALAAQFATDVLYALSGRRYPGPRVATLTVPPTVQGPRSLLPVAAPWASGTVRQGCGGCVSGFDPQLYPIRAVLRLTIGGTDVPAEQIKLSGQQTVSVVAGTTADPLAVNRWCGPDGAYSLFPGGCGCSSPGVELTFVWGQDPPAGGVAAAQLLAVEVLKGLNGDECRLPGNVVSVNRQGVSVVLDPAEILDNGRTGIPLADTWLAAVNPAGLKAAPTLWWPESGLSEVVG